MLSVSPAMKDVAQRLLAHETDGRSDIDALAVAIERIHLLLRDRLGGLIGQAGFAALFSRALHLARRENPILIGISLDTQSRSGLQGTREFAMANAGDPGTAALALAKILEHVIWLLITFIGEELSMRLIADIWPELAHLEMASAGGDGEMTDE
ncbi:MAG: hypothetical protein M3439_11460 [Chloroflexota bacterium]|nr:hypothetical protein [Chloroflexota bacterium]